MKSILIIDDDEEEHYFLRRAFSDAGLQVTTYSVWDASLAMGFLEKLSSPSLIILDLNMPKTDGFELLIKIKEQYDVPVLVYTTTCTDETARKTKACGAFNCIKKPTSQVDILKTLEIVSNALGLSLISQNR